MKIKSVSQQTGLTDRAIRFYIEEGLISPAYTENYMGRRSFTFTQADVESLCDIAVLRKFGFTVAEIREMTEQPEKIGSAMQALKARKEKNLSEEQDLLRVLVQSEAEYYDDVHALVSVLSKPVEKLSLPAEDQDSSRSRRRRFLRSAGVFLATWAPFFNGAYALLTVSSWSRYPVMNYVVLFLTLLSLTPSLLLVLLPRLPVKEERRSLAKCLLLISCVISIGVTPVLCSGIVTCSKTTDFANYRRLDADCHANTSEWFQNVFPLEVHYLEYKQVGKAIDAVHLDAHYMYRYFVADSCDIYAELPLNKEEFNREVQRINSYCEAIEAKSVENGHASPFVSLQMGPYTCLILCDGIKPFEPKAGSYTSSYTYCIFAYNPVSLRVRYLYGDFYGWNPDPQPYYFELEWD